jgi:hypothetical protein
MATLSALITAAIIKVAATNPAMDREDGPSADEARDAFTEALLKELGLGPVAAHAPVSEPTGTPTKARKAASPAAPKKAKKAKTEEDADVAALTAAVAELTLAPAAEEPKAKKPRAPKKVKEEVKTEVAPEPKPASNAGAGAEPVAAPKKKPGPKPKAPKPEGPVNLEKLNPTQKKHLKTIAAELKVEPREKEFLAYANAMSAEEWAKPLDGHIRAFLLPAPVPLAPPPTEFQTVEFKGVDYLVDMTTKIVWENVPEDAPVRNRLGFVGQLEFKDMEIPA